MMSERYKYLKGFTFNACYVRTRSVISFAAQKWVDSDPLEQRPTAIFFYYPEKSEERKWAVSGIGHATGIHGCAAFQPEERWVFVLDDGEVYVVGKGDDDYEKPVSNKQNLFFSNVKAIRCGHAVAVGGRRKVFIRKAPNQWVKLDNGLFPQGDQTDLNYAGFDDIDGFSENDMYACGGRGDLWHYDGNIWRNIDLQTNAVLKNICCGDDGMVYITTNRKQVLRGRGQMWETIEQEKTDRIIESIVSYRDRIIVSTVSELYAVEENEFKLAGLGEPPMNSKAHLAAGDGILVVAGHDEAVMFDGNAWSVILKPAL